MKIQEVKMYKVSCDRCGYVEYFPMTNPIPIPNVTIGDKQFWACESCLDVIPYASGFNKLEVEEIDFNNNDEPAQEETKTELHFTPEAAHEKLVEEYKEPEEEKIETELVPLSKKTTLDHFVRPQRHQPLPALYINNRVWDSDKIDQLVQLLMDGTSISNIAKYFNTTNNSINAMRFRIAHSRPGDELYSYKQKLENVKLNRSDNKRSWEEKELDKLMDLLSNGTSYKEIGKILNRSRPSIDKVVSLIRHSTSGKYYKYKMKLENVKSNMVDGIGMFTADQVLDMINLWNTGNYSVTAIADELGFPLKDTQNAMYAIFRVIRDRKAGKNQNTKYNVFADLIREE